MNGFSIQPKKISLGAMLTTHRTITLAVTGASGSVFARQMLCALEADPRVGHINLVVSNAGLRVVTEELGPIGRTGLVRHLLGSEPAKTQLQDNEDTGANIASGSYPTDAMVVLPCTMGTLAKVANGCSDLLIERAADVCLKEHIPLVLCVRETPFNRVHLRNMSLAAEAGATIYPLIPVLYNHPATVDDMINHYVNRVLQHIGLAQQGAYVWKPNKPPTSMSDDR
jgi:4-hydroxy-3-polyprenylbenzoate decarboxylase